MPVGNSPTGTVVTYLPLHADRLDGPETAGRLMRHVMASVIMENDPAGIAHLASLAPSDPPLEFGAAGPFADFERQIGELAAGVGRGLRQLRRRRFDGLSELAGHVVATIGRLRQKAADDPSIAPAVLFLDWKLRMMPAYDPARIFEENERELRRAAKAFRMVRETAARLWPGKVKVE